MLANVIAAAPPKEGEVDILTLKRKVRAHILNQPTGEKQRQKQNDHLNRNCPIPRIIDKRRKPKRSFWQIIGDSHAFPPVRPLSGFPVMRPTDGGAVIGVSFKKRARPIGRARLS